VAHTREDGSVKWAAVAAQLPGRTDNEVARQHTKMVSKWATLCLASYYLRIHQDLACIQY